ncbi:MAG: ferritin-like domain-containing protein [Myxococcota bacterium]
MTQLAGLSRIEKAIKSLSETQKEISEKLSQLTQHVEALAGNQASPSVAKEEVIRFLDGFRAAEALGEASLGVWIDACTTDCVRGGLRTVQMREGAHARLLEARIKELGGSPAFEIPEAVHNQVMEQAATTEKTDAQKVLEFVQRFPDVEGAVKPIHDMADRLDDDPETQSLLRTIAQDERATLEFLHEACSALNPQ